VVQQTLHYKGHIFIVTKIFVETKYYFDKLYFDKKGRLGTISRHQTGFAASSVGVYSIS